MKFKHLPLLFLFITVFAACSDDGGDKPAPSNTDPPGIDGIVDGAEWKATYYEATYSSNIVSIEAHTQDGANVMIQFVAAGGAVVGTHQILANSTLQFVTFTTADGKVYSTKNFNSGDPNPGKVIIDKMDEANKILNGTCQSKLLGPGSNEITINLIIDDIPYK